MSVIIKGNILKHSLKIVKLFTLILFLSLYLTVYFITTKDKNSRIELILNQEITNLKHNYRVITDKYNIISNIVNHEIFNKPDILELLCKAKNAKNTNELNTMRTILYYEIKPNFERLKDMGVNAIQFVFENNKSFLRVDKPDMYGDDLSKSRYSFAYVNSNIKPISGFEFEKNSHAFRNLFPLFYYNEFLGSVEISFSSKSMQESMLKLHDTDTNFIINKNMLNVKTLKDDTDINYVTSIEHNDFFSINNKDAVAEYKTKINLFLKDKIALKIQEQKQFSLYHHYNKETYIISFLPVQDVSKKHVGAYIVSYTKSQYLEGMLHEYLWVNGVAFFGILLLCVVIYFNLRHRINLEKTVNERTSELEKEKTKAQNATKTKSQFLANMSHEIRTPINGVIGISYLLLQTKLTKKQRDYLEKIDTSAKSLLGIINDILDISKIEAGKLTIENIEFNLHESINRVVTPLEVVADEKNININIEYADDVGEFFIGDALRISQILTNLLGNAIKFTNNGNIDIKVTKTGSSRLKFEVKDTGIGLSEEEQKKLFVSFSQADSSTTRKYGGTGLGLAISKQLVELMGGKIWVESKEDEGSNFIFELELQEVKSSAKEINEEPVLVDKNIFNEKRILIAEDNITNQMVILGLLEDYITDIDVANNGEEAVALFEKGKYDLILMDIQMPIMDGYEATKIIRGIDENIPIIALTANAMSEEVEKTKAAKMNEHLTKPIDVAKLFNTISKYINSNLK